MKKMTIWIALVGLVCFVGCTHGLVFVKKRALNRVEDNGSDLATVNVPATGRLLLSPGCLSQLERIAFRLLLASGHIRGRYLQCES